MNRVLDLMAQSADLPWGEGRTMLVEEALRLAEAAGDDLLAFRVRIELRSAYVQGGETAKAFTAFSRCLSDYDRDPGRFDAGDEHRLLWAFKGTVNALTDFPEVPLDRTYAVLDDMERRYRQGGHGLHPVYTYRCVVARHVGDVEAADHWYAQWTAAPRARLSDCEGCDPGTKVLHLAWRGRDADALALAEPVLNQELTCSEQPATILTELLPVLLREGRFEQAADAHRRAYRTQRSRISELWAIAAHLEFCALSGNEARGLEILQRHLGGLDRAPTPHVEMAFAAAGALLLRRLAETGHGDVAVRRSDDTEVPAAALRAELAERALNLAARFDARNRTSEQGDLVRATLAAEPLVGHLPLTSYARPPAAPVPAPAVPEPPVSSDPDELLDLAEEHWRRRDGAAATAAWHRFDELAAEPTPLRLARRADGRGFELLMGGDLAAGTAEWERSIELYAAAGDEVRRQSAISRLAAVRLDAGAGEDELVRLEAAADHLAEHAPGTRRAVAARLRLAAAHTSTGRPDLALKVLDGVETADPADRAEVELVRAQALIGAGDDRAAAVGALRRAAAGFRAEGPAALLAEASLLLGQLLDREDAGGDESAEALAALTEAIVLAGPDPRLRTTGYAVRGAALLARDRAAEAADDLVEAVAGFTAAGAHRQAAYARVDLAAAYLGSERPLDAAEALEEALPVFAEAGDADTGGRARYLLAGAQRELGEMDEAAGTFTELAGDLEHPGLAGQCYESAAELLTELDKDGPAAERFGSAAAAFRAAGDEQGAVRALRRRGMCLLWSGQGEAGLVELAAARELVSGWPDAPPRTWETALLDYDEARVLASLGRPAEALPPVDRAVEAFTALAEAGAAEAATALRAEIADSLDA